jgi:ATP-dependent 26S proteasome regulatory subunit
MHAPATTSTLPDWLPACRVTPEPDLDWDAIVGLPHVVDVLRSMVARIASPHPVDRRTVSRAALLHGMPGSGKTLASRVFLASLARALAGTGRRLDAYAIPAAEMTEQRFGDLSRALAARRDDAQVLIYFDEIDTFSRRATPMRERSAAAAAMLGMLDGLDAGDRDRHRTLILAASNARPGELDAAIVRAGRLGDLLVEFGPLEREHVAALLARELGPYAVEPIDWLRAARLMGTRQTGADVGLAAQEAIGFAIDETGEPGVRWTHVVGAVRRLGRIEDVVAVLGARVVGGRPNQPNRNPDAGAHDHRGAARGGSRPGRQWWPRPSGADRLNICGRQQASASSTKDCQGPPEGVAPTRLTPGAPSP